MIQRNWIDCEACEGQEGHFQNGEWVDCEACEGQGGREIIVNSDCGHQCYIIGGGFIAEDPACPIHGTNNVDD